MVTIKDIAIEAGVSHGTVSNVLNKTGKVSLEKIKLVEEAAKKLGYVRNTQAQQLRQGFKKLIAVIIPSLESSHYSEFFSTLRDILITYDYEVNLYTTNDTPVLEKNILDNINFSRLDAIVTVSSLSDEKSIYNCNCPVIFIDREPINKIKNSSYVSFDFKLAGKEIGEYIKSKKFKSIAYFSGTKKYTPERYIYEGLVQSLKCSEDYIQHFTSDDRLSKTKAFDIVSGDNSDFDVIITSNLDRAESVLSAYNFSNSNKTPHIITIDNTKIFPNNHFTSYELNYKTMGKIVADSLIDYLINKNPLSKNKILRNDGFRFNFPYLKENKHPKKLNMLTVYSPSSEALQKLLPNFKKATGIEVKLNVLSFEDLYDHITMVGDNNFYDLIRIDVAWMSKLASSIYMPFKDTGKDFSSIFSNILDDAKTDYSYVADIQYALPFDPSTLIFLYRKDLFEDAIIKRSYYEMFHENLTIPTNFEQYNKIASFFTKTFNKESPTKYGSTLTFGSAAVASCDFLPRLLNKTNNLFDENGRIIINTKEVLYSLKNYIETYKYSNKKGNNWWRDSIKEFSNGSTAMAISFSNHASDVINNKHSSIVGNVGCASIPGNNPILGGGVIGISKNCIKIDECYEFFKWFYSDEISTAFTLLGGLSPNKSVYNNYNLLDIFPWLSQAKSDFYYGSRKLTNIHHPKFDQKKFENILGNAVRSAIIGTHTPEEALEYAQKLYDIEFIPTNI